LVCNPIAKAFLTAVVLCPSAFTFANSDLEIKSNAASGLTSNNVFNVLPSGNLLL
jgi:hypothetical protein